ncbi:hypothetical protein AVEN_239139-1 [Araneus ventricosus]|uniref:Uncharacterized protein n=1 Tax=Araneus ventricosus TaxID=182803 RepID=A0A4Y2H9V0_ARAVE|nr:hypothetical protein AVEN_239139-1 [Araneus ventricosus]
MPRPWKCAGSDSTNHHKSLLPFSHMMTCVKVSPLSCFSVTQTISSFSIFSWRELRSLEIVVTPLAGVIPFIDSFCLSTVHIVEVPRISNVARISRQNFAARQRSYLK